LGRFEVLELLGKSQGSTVWAVHDPRDDRDLIVTLPRVQPADAAAVERWMTPVHLAARLDHPRLAPTVEIGVEENWPYVAVERKLGMSLGEWVAAHPNPAPAEVVGWICQVLEGLAFAHEAGSAHTDLQLHNVLVNDDGRVLLCGLAAASSQAPARGAAGESIRRGIDRSVLAEADVLRSQREAAERDVVACGLLLHVLLTGQPLLDEPDLSRVARRLAPTGRDVVRLPWNTPHPIPEALRAIANRASASQQRQRYLSARTFLRALTGWLEAEALGRDGPLELMLDRLRTVGALPGLPNMSVRVERLVSMDMHHAEEITRQVLHDMALSFELLREVNSALFQSHLAEAAVPVLTIRRAVALLGLDGVRHSANALRLWPGPLSEEGARELRQLMDRVRLAGHVAQAFRPPGYDAEVVFIATVFQNLGRLLAQYHFPDESRQIRFLMQPIPPPADAPRGTPPVPGWSESDASYAVLGVDIDAIGAAVARHWGLGDEMMHMIRRLPRNLPVRAPDNDIDVLRITASAANEAVDALSRGGADLSTSPPETTIVAALDEPASSQPIPLPATGRTSVAARYARSLGLTPRMVQESIRAARHALRTGKPILNVAPVADSLPTAPQSAVAAA
jgi:non-specific serine/threonine protein kinase